MTLHRLDLTRIRAITLDLDDTLWPVWPTITHAEDTLRTWLDAHAPRTAALARDAQAVQGARRTALAFLHGQSHDLGALRREAIRQLLAAAGDDTALAHPAFEVFLAARHQVSLFDDALPALAALSARYPVIALSNGNADVHRVGIGGYFRAAVSAADVGVGKPDARIFHAAAQAAGVAPAQVLHIGDDALLDGQGALAVGMQMAWINRARAPWPEDVPAQPHVEVGDLAALCAWLGA